YIAQDHVKWTIYLSGLGSSVKVCLRKPSPVAGLGLVPPTSNCKQNQPKARRAGTADRQRPPKARPADRTNAALRSGNRASNEVASTPRVMSTDPLVRTAVRKSSLWESDC